MTDWSLAAATDLALLTREYIEKQIEHTFKDPTYQIFNMMLSETKEITGKTITSKINLDDEG